MAMRASLLLMWNRQVKQIAVCLKPVAIEIDKDGIGHRHRLISGMVRAHHHSK